MGCLAITSFVDPSMLLSLAQGSACLNSGRGLTGSEKKALLRPTCSTCTPHFPKFGTEIKPNDGFIFEHTKPHQVLEMGVILTVGALLQDAQFCGSGIPVSTPFVQKLKTVDALPTM